MVYVAFYLVPLVGISTLLNPFVNIITAPATNVIEHQHQLSATFTQVSKYSAPRTIEGDDAWEELYLPCTSGLSTIITLQHHSLDHSSDYWQALPRSMVKDTLVNRTARPPGDEEYYGEPRYVIGLDVFHKIHCLVEYHIAL